MTKIMLVEDDNNLREIYEARLLAEGYEIISAKDGEEALSLAMKERPDLIISDVMMPKISGFDMLDLLRSTPETRDTKVIMMTALSQAEDKNRADKLGANRYLVKSQVTLEDVAKVAREVIEGEPGQPPAAPAATTPATDTASPADSAPVTPASTPVVAPPDPTPVASAMSNATTATDDTTVQPSTSSTNDQPIQSSATTPVADPASTPVVAPPDPTPTPTEGTPTPPAPTASPTSAELPEEPLPTTDMDSNLATSIEAESNAIESQINEFVSTVPSNEPPVEEVAPAPVPPANPTPVTPAEEAVTSLPTEEAPATIPVKEAPPLPTDVPAGNNDDSPRKKVIQPINDLSATGANLNELLEKEQLKEAAAPSTPTPAPVATSVVGPGGATVTPAAADQPANATVPGATVAPSGDDPANVAL